MVIIAQPTAELLRITPDAEKLIEEAGREAYKSAERITDNSYEMFLASLLNMGHMSVFEHASATIKFYTDRGVTHEMVRHRIASYTQESTRYCNYSKDKYGNEITVIEPPGLLGIAHQVWFDAVRTAEERYMKLLEIGYAPQIARSVLPTCLGASIVMTANFREWLHFFNLRMSSKAHPQMRQVATMAYKLLHEKAPCVFRELPPKTPEFNCGGEHLRV